MNTAPVAAGSAVRQRPVPKQWRVVALAILLALLAPLLLYADTAKSIVSIWNSSETFAHGYLILPISLWLIWRRRTSFIAMPPTPWWPALGLLLLLGFAWLLARMGEVQVVMQYAIVAMIPAIALAVLGRRLAWSLAFPLLFLLLAVPFGEVFIDPLISFTADFTIWALQVTGIPVLRNGNRFEIPSGSWSVVEACSGVRYLIASITLGSLYAYLTYRSTLRRALFMLMAVVVPVIANGLRAYMIVMIGHLSGMTLAVGVDHLIYGWVFFGLVMFLMFWIGGFWRENQPAGTSFMSAAATPGDASLATPAPLARTSSAVSLFAAVLAVFATTAVWPLMATHNDRATYNTRPVRLDPIQASWDEAPAFSIWEPRFAPADAALTEVFRDREAADRQPVALSLLYYRNQRNGHALISSTNRLVDEEGPFHVVQPSLRSEAFGPRTLMLREATVQGPAGPILVWTCYWIDGQFTASNYGGKLLQAKAKLLLRSDDGAALLLWAPYATDAEQARLSLRAFLGSNLDAIQTVLVTARER